MLGFPYLPRPLPKAIEELSLLATDLRWTWSHEGDALWRLVDAATWKKTENPYEVLQNLSEERIEKLAEDRQFQRQLQDVVARRQDYFSQPDWFSETIGTDKINGIVYLSMEFGLGEALPLYAGGLGILAGDYLKSASDLGVPVTAVGLLYQEGYFRQVLDADGWQQEAYPYNDPMSLPVFPVQAETGGWLKIDVDLPGRKVNCRVWQARVGRVGLYLLDTNDPLNGPIDRGITGKLYGGGEEMRLVQEIVLGIGGWELIEALQIPAEVCHLNEGHAAFVTLERAYHAMQRHAVGFSEALWLTRPGNLFTTHTAVPAGFDTYPPELVERYGSVYSQRFGTLLPELAGLGRLDPADQSAPFSMALLAARTCGAINGVSRLHGSVSRRIFQDLFPRWPQDEVPVVHVTNGVHVPSWDSPWADEIWTRACGKERWRGNSKLMSGAMEALSDEELWNFDALERQDLIDYVRARLVSLCQQRGAATEIVDEAGRVLAPDVLTLGFARRFAAYKRPNLLLHDPERLVRLLTNTERPVQLLIAGKAHPRDDIGKGYIQQWARFVRRPDVRRHAVFLEDYDMALAQELVQGVDVWINTPRRPWEACGTSGMKVLANGGLNLSVLDGWWDEAFDPTVGWALGDRQDHAPEQDEAEANTLYEVLEKTIVPLFYQRDETGIPRAWVARMRASLSRLAPQYSANRMVREYVEQLYAPAAQDYRQRNRQGAQKARELSAWEAELRQKWPAIRWGQRSQQCEEGNWKIEIEIYLGALSHCQVEVQLWAEGLGGGPPRCLSMNRIDDASLTEGWFRYQGELDASRRPGDYTARVIPSHPTVRIPIELSLIDWQEGN